MVYLGGSAQPKRTDGQEDRMVAENRTSLWLSPGPVQTR